MCTIYFEAYKWMALTELFFGKEMETFCLHFAVECNRILLLYKIHLNIVKSDAVIFFRIYIVCTFVSSVVMLWSHIPAP